jgi:hypothetical protein
VEARSAWAVAETAMRIVREDIDTEVAAILEARLTIKLAQPIAAEVARTTGLSADTAVVDVF